MLEMGTENKLRSLFEIAKKYKVWDTMLRDLQINIVPML